MHKSPWLARGYLRLEDDGSATPRLAGPGEVVPGLVPHATTYGGATVDSAYVLA